MLDRAVEYLRCDLIPVISMYRYVLRAKKEYQAVDDSPIVATAVKVRGVTLDSDGTVWGSVDTVVPPQVG